jgi:hypothetical protein
MASRAILTPRLALNPESQTGRRALGSFNDRPRASACRRPTSCYSMLAASLLIPQMTCRRAVALGWHSTPAGGF